MVIVRGYGDQAMLRRAWAEEDGLVLIHDEQQYRNHLNGESHLEPVPFRRGSVFACPETLATRLKARGWCAPWEEVEAELKVPA